MSLQDRYDELTEIIDTLDSLIDSITDKDYIEQLRETKYQAENERDEIEPDLLKEQWQEENQREYEYERSAIWIFTKKLMQ